MKKYILLLILLTGCIRIVNKPASSFGDLPKCNPHIGKKTRGFDNFTMDNGDILFVAKFSDYKCIHRKTK